MKALREALAEIDKQEWGTGYYIEAASKAWKFLPDPMRQCLREVVAKGPHQPHDTSSDWHEAFHALEEYGLTTLVAAPGGGGDFWHAATTLGAAVLKFGG